jgi:myo-inositol 2-dehydrogenase/D-chiro-inositol 1-dehydrogenase
MPWGNRGEEFFAAAADVDTASALLTLDDGTLAVVSSARYNGAGYDVRLEVFGSGGSISVGLDDHMPLRSAEPGVSFPAGPAYPGFMERFRAAYEAELSAFAQLVAGGGRRGKPVHHAGRAGSVLRRRGVRVSRSRGAPVAVAEVRG